MERQRPEEPRPRPWGQDRRFEFVEFRLLWEGKINRGEVANYFQISLQQASLDFARYMELAPANMEYDRREKIYRTTKTFKPLFIAPDTQTYLNEITGLATGTIPPALSFVGKRPSCDVVTLPIRRVRIEILLPILWSIRDGTEIEATYQSMRSLGPTRQWIAPHSLAYDGTRWHARAWCHRSSQFRDFVLTRIQQIHDGRERVVNPHDDADWFTFAVVEVAPNPNLSSSQRQCVVDDFGMVEGKLSKSIRRSLVPYFVRHLRIDEGQTSQPIIWANRDQFDSMRPRREV